MGKKIVYVGNFAFPLGNAVAKRVLGIGTALSLAGYDVIYIGEDKDVKLGEISEEMHYEQFRYYNIHKPISQIEHYRYIRDVKNIRKKLQEWQKNGEISALIFCGTKSALFAYNIVRVCKKLQIPIIADSMDWLNSRTGNLLFDFIKQLDINFELCFVNKKADVIIAISEYLKRYYEKCGLETVVIPPICPYNSMISYNNKNDRISFIYAGVPCRLGRPLKRAEDAKDRLDLAIRLLYSIHKKGYDYQFQVYGLSKEQYVVIYPEQNSMIEELTAFGKLSFMGYAKEDVVRKAVEVADFTILLRNTNRVTMAGFPTKIAESISLGTPVITTETSDINKYICDGIDGYFLDILNMEKAEEKLVHIIEQREYCIEILKKNTRENNCFRPKTYVEKLEWVLDTINQTD